VKNIAVFASGNGTNLQALIDHVARGALGVRIVLVVSDQRKAFALQRARKAGIKTFVFDPRAARADYEKVIIAELKKEKADLIVLAGFMRILSAAFVRRYKNRILNIHPALLPAFKGGRSIRDAFGYGAKITGVTVHFVDEKVDNGPIIMQESVPILDSESCDELEAKIHRLEHKIYARALERIARGRYRVSGRKVILR
jgi:phosphoribosylglycinamide formyltransferase-1